MDYVHFDLAAIEQQMRAMRDTVLQDAVARAEGTQKASILAQDALFEPHLAVLLATFRMKNDGASDAFITHVLGVFVANIFTNAVSASASPDTAIRTMFGKIRDGLNAAFGSDDVAPGITLAAMAIDGERGGRA